MPPPLLSSRHDNPAIEAWATQEQPLSSYTLSHQSPQLQRSMSQRRPELEQVPELENVGEDPAAWMSRTGISPVLTLTPVLPSTPSRSQLSPINTQHQLYNMHTPTTPTSDSQSLTTATTLTSNTMSRQNSLYSEPLLESMQMMKFDSNTSFSTDLNSTDPTTLYDQITPHYTSSRHSRRSSSEEQSQLLVGAGGGHDSHFSLAFPSAEKCSQFQSSGFFGEKMEKSQSNESTSSTSSVSSRSKQRLAAQNAMAAVRPLMPKGGDDQTMSRDNSSQSMVRLESKDGTQDKIAISKPTYQRPKHDRVYCKQCDEHAEGFRGEHELRRHVDRVHKKMVKKWVCITPPAGYDSAVKPAVPLTRCKACHQQKKQYGAYYNAAAHLRRAHFRPKAKGRSKSGKLEDAAKRGGKAGGNWPTMEELKPWMVEVEVMATEYPLTTAQQEEADAEDDDDYDNLLDEPTSAHSMTSGSFENPYMSDITFSTYTTPNNTDLFGMQNMPYLDLSSQQSIDSSMSCSQNSFDTFASFQNDHLAFDHSSISIPQNLDEQLFVLDPVYSSYS